MRDSLQTLPTWLVVVLLAGLFLLVSAVGWWRGSRRDTQDLNTAQNIGITALSVAMAGFSLLGSFAAASLWNAESSRTSLLAMELSAARAMVLEAQTPGTADASAIARIVTAYATSLEAVYAKGELESSDMHGYDPMLELQRALRPVLPTDPTTASQQALEKDFRDLIAAHNQRTTAARPLLPGIVFGALLAMGISAAYVAGRIPMGRSRDIKVTQVLATTVILTALMTIVIVLDSPATAADRSIPALQSLVAWLQGVVA